MAEDQDANIEQNDAGNAPGEADQSTVDEALAEAQASVDELMQEAGEPPVEEPVAAEPQAVEMPNLGDDGAPAATGGIDMLRDVDLHVTIELGRTQMFVEDVLKLSDGAVVELDKLAGDPVDVYVNSCLIARGEVLVLNDNFCIRISEIVENLEEQAEEAAREQMQAV